MRHVHLVLVSTPLLLACDPAHEALPTETAPVGGLTLAIAGFGGAGATYTATVEGAASGQTVALAVGPNQVPGATCPPPLGGLCLDITNPTIVALGPADGSGTAVLTFQLPASLPSGVDGWFQAGAGGATPAVSNVQFKWIPTPGEPVDLHGRMDVSLDTLTGTGDGALVYRFVESTTGRRYCSARFDALLSPSAEPLCPGCEYAFAFDGVGTPTFDTRGGEDCVGTGYDAFLPPPGMLHADFGIDADYLSPTGPAPLLFSLYNGNAYAYTAGTFAFDDTTGEGVLRVTQSMGYY